MITNDGVRECQQTDEDMFRALNFPNPDAPLRMDPPISLSLLTKEKEKSPEPSPVSLQLLPNGIFTTVVGHPSKRTLAKWHVTSPAEVVDSLLQLAAADKGIEEIKL